MCTNIPKGTFIKIVWLTEMACEVLSGGLIYKLTGFLQIIGHNTKSICTS